MEQRRNYAALKDAQINLIQEECVGDMGRRGSFAVVKDVRINLIQEEYASGMGQRRHGAKKKGMLCGSQRSCSPQKEKWYSLTVPFCR
eukprot:scaffold22065_cov68-Skeletonema_marinoi.AAC.1